MPIMLTNNVILSIGIVLVVIAIIIIIISSLYKSESFHGDDTMYVLYHERTNTYIGNNGKMVESITNAMRIPELKNGQYIIDGESYYGDRYGNGKTYTFILDEDNREDGKFTVIFVISNSKIYQQRRLDAATFKQNTASIQFTRMNAP